MSKVELDVNESNEKVQESLKMWLLKKAQTWINGLLEAEMTEHLRRGRYERAKGSGRKYRNGHRPRRLNILGLGSLQLRIPRDREGTYKSYLLPERRGQAPEMEAFLCECFLAGLSTRDISRISEKHLGKRYDSKQVSRIVARASEELDGWQNRTLEGREYKFLFVDGANFKVRINHRVSKQSFCAVLGINEIDEVIEVLAVAMGDREKADLWADIFADMQRRGMDMKAVELGIMDGLPGLEDCFRKLFPRAQTQRCQKHASANALRRVRKSDREAFHKNLNAVFYASSEAEARRAFHDLREIWGRHYPGAVNVIERDLDSLLRFYQFNPTYWTTIRTTNPIERLNKEVKRRTKAMEVTGGELTTYRIITYTAMTIEYRWSFHPVTQWAHIFDREMRVYTLNAA